MLKYSYKILSWGFNCNVCPNNCPQSCHELSDQIFKKTYKIDYIKVEEMINENEKGKLSGGLNYSKKLLKNLEAEEEVLKKKFKIIEITQEEVKQKCAELKKIAINCTSYQTTIEFLHELPYFPYLVVCQKFQKKVGFSQTIRFINFIKVLTLQKLESRGAVI